MARGLRRRLKTVRAYLSGDSRGLPGPAALAVETTVRCNLRCPMCPRTGAGYPAEDMPDELLYPLLEQHAALGGDVVWLNGLGEPFLDERLFDVLDRCRALGLSTVVATNATRLDAGRRRRLLASGCQHLIASIDGATAETYRAHRPGGRFEQVVADVEALATEKLLAGSPMALTVQLVLMAGTLHERDAFLRRWSAVPGVDAVRTKAEEFGLEHFSGANPRSEGRYCRIPWSGPLIVRWNGDVALCHPKGAARHHLGSLLQEDLESLWRGPRAEALRRAHARGQPGWDPDCARCPVLHPRRPFVVAAMLSPGAAVQRAIPWAERLQRRGLPLSRRRPDR